MCSAMNRLQPTQSVRRSAIFSVPTLSKPNPNTRSQSESRISSLRASTATNPESGIKSVERNVVLQVFENQQLMPKVPKAVKKNAPKTCRNEKN